MKDFTYKTAVAAVSINDWADDDATMKNYAFCSRKLYHRLARIFE